MTNKFVSIRHVAKDAGVSIATVSRVVNGITDRAKPETIQRVLQSVEKLDYRPHSVSRALKMKESRIVGVLVANLGNPSMAAVAGAIEDALRSQGYVMALCDTHENEEIQDQYLREMESQLAIAIVMVVAVESEMLERLRNQKRPIIFVARRDPLKKKSSFVGIDDLAAGETVAKYCIGQGFKTPNVLHASIEYSAGAMRLAGIQSAYQRLESGMKLPTFTSEGINHQEIGYNAARDAMQSDPQPDALICLSDLIAFGAYRWLQENFSAFTRWPRLIGFDDNPLNDWINPWLTSVRCPYQELGSAVLLALSDLLADLPAKDYLLPHKLILRNVGSPSCPNPAADLQLR